MPDENRPLYFDLREALREELEVLDPAGPAMTLIAAPFKDFLVYLHEMGNLDESDARVVELELEIGKMLGGLAEIAHEALRALRDHGLLRD